MKTPQAIALGAILLLYLLTGALYAIYTPDWQAPDEPAHYNYIRQLAAGSLPVIEAADYDQTYINQVISSGFDPQYAVTSFSYEDWQPPLYYLLQTPIHWLSGGSLTALRLFSVVLGAGVVLLAYLVAGQLFPMRPWLALGVAVFVAFLPQHLAILSSVNNDSLAELLVAGILFLLLPVARFGKSRSGDLANRATSRSEQTRLLLIGSLLGLGFLTKGTVYPLTAVVGLALLGRYWGRWSELVRAGLFLFVPAVALGALWWGRNLVVYGGLDLFGKATHDAVVVGQPRTAEWIALYRLGGTIGRFIQTTFTSFWGQFGWMALPLQGWPYWFVLGLSLLGLSGLLLTGGQGSGADLETGRLRDWETRDIRNPQSAIRDPQWPGPTVILLLTFVLTLGVHVWYNLTFVQHQGRYLFPALIPIGIGLVVGLAFWLRPLTRRWSAAGYLLPLGLALTLIPLAWYSLFRIIIPGL